MNEPITPYQLSKMQVTVGLVSGSATAAQFPAVAAQMVMFQSYDGNTDKFYIGDSTNTVFWEINADEETQWMYVEGGNLSNLYFKNSSGTSQKLAYMAMY